MDACQVLKRILFALSIGGFFVVKPVATFLLDDYSFFVLTSPGKRQAYGKSAENALKVSFIPVTEKREKTQYMAQKMDEFVNESHIRMAKKWKELKMV